MLNDLPADHVPQLGKMNMFCFDSESFRYLAAIKTSLNIQFNEDQKVQFGMSWKKSVAESIRLINVIKSCPEYRMNTWHSIKHAQIMITSLIRPMMETTRSVFRNLLLWQGDKRYTIELYAQSVAQSSYLCTACPYRTTQIKDFPIIKYSIHHYRKSGECDKCQCKHIDHLPILYELRYKSNAIENSQIHTQAGDSRDRLLRGCLIFTRFLLHTARTNEDPFLPWLDLFIREELYLCSQESSNILNTELQMHLQDLKDEYQKQLHETKHDQDHTSIDKIYQWIEKVQEFQMINEQMNAIKTSQMEIMKNHEHDASSQYPDINMSVLLTGSAAEN
jgi:hypothetical protein